jgi:hypothetical protein
LAMNLARKTKGKPIFPPTYFDSHHQNSSSS